VRHFSRCFKDGSRLADRGGAGKMELERVSHEEREEWESMDRSWKIGEWMDRHKWEFVIGSWVTGMGVSGTIISKNRCASLLSVMRTDSVFPRRYQTFAQKVTCSFRCVCCQSHC
jgi:hypothetical protein